MVPSNQKVHMEKASVSRVFYLIHSSSRLLILKFKQTHFICWKVSATLRHNISFYSIILLILQYILPYSLFGLSSWQSYTAL